MARPNNAETGRSTLPPGAPWTGSVHSVGLVLVVLLAAGLRFHDLDRTSLWLDEAVSWQQASKPFLEMIAATARDNYPPLHNIILHVTMALFGDGETALRAPSALLGVANVYVLYLLGSALWDRTTGLIAALLLTVSGFHVWYSTEARMYALLAFTATLFVLTVVYATRRPNWLTLTGCAAAGTALLYSHVYGSFVFAGVNIVVLTALLLRNHWLAVDWKSWIAAQAVPVFLFLPWALILWGRAHHATESLAWIPEPTARFLLEQALEFGGVLSLGMLGSFASLSLINLSALFPRFWRKESASSPTKAKSWLRADWQNAILIGWLVAPISAAYLISVIGQPILVAKYLICTLPALLLLAARGLRLSNHSIPTMAVILGVVVLTALPDLLYDLLLRARDDNKDAAQEFSIRYRPSDRIFFIPSYASVPFQYYFRKPLADSRTYKEAADVSPTDLNIDRFWFVFIQRQADDASEGMTLAERTHLMTFSLLLPQLKMFLFERRDIGHREVGHS